MPPEAALLGGSAPCTPVTCDTAGDSLIGAEVVWVLPTHSAVGPAHFAATVKLLEIPWGPLFQHINEAVHKESLLQ